MDRNARVFKTILNKRWATILAAAALILVVLLMLFALFRGLMIQSLSQLNNEFVEQVDTISATSLNIIQTSAMQMFYSSSVKTLRTAEVISNAQRMSGLRDLGSFVSSCTFLTNAMIYNPAMDYVFTSDGDHPSAPSQYFYDSEAVALLKNASELSFGVPNKRSNKTGDYYSFIFYEPNVAKSGSLLLNVRAQWYEQQLLGISSGASCAILDGDGKALAAGSEALTAAAEQIWPEILKKSGADGAGFILDKHSSQGWMYCKLRNSGWFYLRSFDSNTVIPSLTKMRNTAFVLLAAVCSILIAGALYTLVNLYTPFAAVKKALIDAGETDGEISQKVDSLLESQLEQRLLKQFERIISGEEKNQLRYPISMVLTDTAQSARLRAAAAAEFDQLTVCADFGCAVLLFAVKEDDVRQFCCGVSQELSCRCFYGHPRTSSKELFKCRQNLNELWQLRFLYTGQRIISENLLDSCVSSGFQPKDCSALLSALRSGQLEEARACWKEIFSKIRYCRFADFRFAIRYIIKSLDNIYKESSAAPLELSAVTVDSLEDIQQLHQAFDAAFIKIVNAEEKRRMKRLDQIAAQINSRISAGYFDDTLSVQHIADEMGMNAVYLGRLFRQSTGISISEAINRIRVQNAKRLLLETGDSVESIAKMVGFNNVKYFFVVFKGIEGITPKKFRQGM